MDFFQTYLNYIGRSEAPAVYHRWAALTAIGAMLGRRFWLEHGAFKIYPNMYVMLLGASGVRKSTSIKIMKSLIKATGYSTIAADRTSKEKFLMDLAGEDGPGSAGVEDILEENLFGPGQQQDREMFIMADEANDFFGVNNLEFLSILGNLWDYEGAYTNRIKTGKSISIQNPTISILSANTPTNFATAFPPEILGQGFFSRLIIVHGESNGVRIPFPKSPSPAATESIVGFLREILSSVSGPARLSPDAEDALSKIYVEGYRVDDMRFESYSNRRFTHLLKLCLINAAARRDTVIQCKDVVAAHTVLSHAEHHMPRALGEFGKAKNSSIADKVLRVIANHPGICTSRDIFTQVSGDLEGPDRLAPILLSLRESGKIQSAHAGEVYGFLPIRKAVDFGKDPFINLSILTDEERNMKT
jgi:energy-coupling factor transporter ATP-binding protein EcfA2